MSTEHFSNFCYGWEMSGDKKLCENLKPFVNSVLWFYGLVPKDESYEDTYSAEDAMYEMSESLYGFADEVINENNIFPLLEGIDEVRIRWDDKNASFAIEVQNFNLSVVDITVLVAEMKILLHKIFEHCDVSLQSIEQQPCYFHYVSTC